MKKVNADFNGDITGLRTSIRVIGNIDTKIADEPLCLISEKNLISVLKSLGTTDAGLHATIFAEKLKAASLKDDFTAIIFQHFLNDQLDKIQFLLDCGELLVGDDKPIKDFLAE